MNKKIRLFIAVIRSIYFGKVFSTNNCIDISHYQKTYYIALIV